MAYTISTTGMEELEAKLKLAGNAAQGVAAASLYEGAGVVADAVSQAVHGIATSPFKYARNGEKRKPSPEEKAMLEGAAKGIAKFRKNGISVDTSVGFSNSGYAAITWNHARTNVRTKYKMNGNVATQAGKASGGASSKPIPVIANAINSGTSFMDKQPFYRKAESQAKGRAINAIDASIQKRVEQILKD